MLKSMLATTAAIGLVSTPVMAQVIYAERAPAAVEDSEKAEGSTGIIIGVIAAAAVIGGIIIIADDDEEMPTSP